MASKASPGESKKEEYRAYLEQAGVVDAMTKVLVTLYEEPEKPDNAIDFLKMNLGAPTPLDMQRVEQEKEAIQQELDAVKEELAAAKAEIEALKAAAEAPPAEE